MPESDAKPQPEFIPEAIRQDYREACRIRDLSPKASATLARRCLQGMIRDFCAITRGKRPTTRRLFGLAIYPHRFRRVAATTLAIHFAAHVQEASPRLAHGDPQTTGAYYARTSGLETHRAFTGHIASFVERNSSPRRPPVRRPHRCEIL